MKYADLHIHSSYSDGAYTPEEIIDIAKKNGVKYISITDHDSIGGQYINGKEVEDIEIISGIELSAEYNEMELHILGYYIDVNNERLRESVKMLNDKRLDRVQKIITNLRKYDIQLGIDELYKNNNETLGRSHIANAMVEKGYFSNYKQAFQSFLIKGKPGYERGFSHDKRDSNEFYNLAKKYKLAITGGSDFHGGSAFRENNIGSCGLDKIMLDKFMKSFK